MSPRHTSVPCFSAVFASDALDPVEPSRRSVELMILPVAPIRLA